ncbi:MAG: glycosyltransferase family 4 protein [Actinobacteria bacterium]|nr:glycosyltransferase family 4 protein [Actinomycetota bacterium]
MRIAIDARLVSYIQGGTSRYTVSLVRAMAALGTSHELVVLEGRKARGNPGWPEDVERRRLRTPPHHRYEQLTLPLELLALGADLLHSPDFIPPFRRPCRSVITIHDLAFLRYPGLLTQESAGYYGQVGRAVESAEQIIAVSEATRRDILELLKVDPAKITVVYEAAADDCIPLSETEVAAHRRRLELPERFILFVGTIEPRKNLALLLKAFARVWEKLRVPLVVVGRNGWLYETVFQTRDLLGFGDEVMFVGPVDGEQLVYYYNCAACLVLPSLYEGFGLPVLEAMACGTPVVTSNVSSLPEIVGNGGLTVDPSDQDGLADAIVRVLSEDELHSRLSQQGIQRARRFSWDRAARETFAVYRKALA